MPGFPLLFKGKEVVWENPAAMLHKLIIKRMLLIINFSFSKQC
jgi:hypothetical protein